jgi:DNA-binding response OmpR family regulator
MTARTTTELDVTCEPNGADSVISGSGSRLRALTVVVADDDEAVRRLVSRVLTRAGFRVLQAPDGREALRLAKAEAAVLVITDLVMPEREGIETIGMLVKLVPKPAVIAISGAFGESMLRAASMLGAAATLQKPISANQLLQAVGSVLGSAYGRADDEPLPWL